MATMYLYLGDGINSVTVHANNSNYPKTFYRSDGVYRYLTELPDSGNLWINAYNDIGFVSGYGHDIAVTTSNPSGSWTLEDDQYFTISAGRTIRLDATQSATYTLKIISGTGVAGFKYSDTASSAIKPTTTYATTTTINNLSYGDYRYIRGISYEDGYTYPVYGAPRSSGTGSFVVVDGNGDLSDNSILVNGDRTVTLTATEKTNAYVSLIFGAGIQSITYNINGGSSVRITQSAYNINVYAGGYIYIEQIIFNSTTHGYPVTGAYNGSSWDIMSSSGSWSDRYIYGISGSYKNVTVGATAKEQHTYYIYYNANPVETGDHITGIPSTQSVTGYDTALSATLSSDTPVYTSGSYTFAGWNTKADGSGVSYAAGASIALSQSMSLYAQWSGVSFTATFHGNGGRWSSGSTKTGSYTTGNTIYFSGYSNGLTRDGYTLAGWTSVQGSTTAAWGVSGTTKAYSSTPDYYAVWTKNIIGSFTYTGSDSGDNTVFVKGASIPTALTAARWNSLLAKIKEVAEAQGGSFAYTQVVSGQDITAAGFNTARTGIAGLPGYGTLPAAKSAGNTVAASFYVGSGSLKAALNNAIDNYNNS